MRLRVVVWSLSILYAFSTVALAQTLVNIRTQDAPKYDRHNNTSSGMGHPMFMKGDTLVALDWDLP